MAGLTVLVTGSTGFIGSHLCRALLARGEHVRAFHRQTSTLRLLSGLDVEHVVGDLTQPETLAAAMQGVHVVFHTAAWMGGRDATGQQYAVTVEGTRNILTAARKAGVDRVVHTSSVAALGVPALRRGHLDPQDRSLWMDECHTWNYRPDFYPYGYAKYLAEQEVQRAVALGMDVVIASPTTVFGRGDLYRSGSSVILMVADRRISVAPDGGNNVIHIDDVVEGHLAALAAGRTGERYILGGQNMTYFQLLQAIAQVVGVPEPGVIVPGNLIRRVSGIAGVLRPFLRLPVSPELLRLAGYPFYYSTRKMESELGIISHRPIKEAIAEAFAWFQGKPVEPPGSLPAAAV